MPEVWPARTLLNSLRISKAAGAAGSGVAGVWTLAVTVAAVAGGGCTGAEGAAVVAGGAGLGLGWADRMNAATPATIRAATTPPPISRALDRPAGTPRDAA